MNKIIGTSSLELGAVPVELDIDQQARFAELFLELQNGLASGTHSWPFVNGGLQSLIDGGLMVRDFPVWKTLKRPRLNRNRAQYMYDLVDMGCVYKSYTALLIDHDLRDRFPHHGGDLDVDVVRVKPHDLGFFGAKRVRRSTLYARALELGLEKAWPEIGYALRLAYNDQMPGEWLIVAVEDDVTTVELTGRVLRLGYSKGVGPVLEIVVSDKHVSADQEFVFIKPRKGAAS
jgi:hypothetical protein